MMVLEKNEEDYLNHIIKVEKIAENATNDMEKFSVAVTKAADKIDNNRWTTAEVIMTNAAVAVTFFAIGSGVVWLSK